jgi:ABC-type transport system involved in cytochrome bd biosynthesis fused ATPase/permease subunit
MDQNISLFNKTISDNIFYKNKNKLKQFDNEIKKRNLNHIFTPAFLEKKVNEREDNLSGGEKRLVLFMRMILNIEKYDVLILDEPTSNVDVHTSNIIHKMINELPKRNKIIIVITHDNNLLKTADSSSLILL